MLYIIKHIECAIEFISNTNDKYLELNQIYDIILLFYNYHILIELSYEPDAINPFPIFNKVYILSL